LPELLNPADGAVGARPRLVNSIRRETNQANILNPP
jgi:hypothetical protein